MKKLKAGTLVPWWLVGYTTTLLIILTRGSTLYPLDYTLGLFVWPVFMFRFLSEYL